MTPEQIQFIDYLLDQQKTLKESDDFMIQTMYTTGLMGNKVETFYITDTIWSSTPTKNIFHLKFLSIIIIPTSNRLVGLSLDINSIIKYFQALDIGIKELTIPTNVIPSSFTNSFYLQLMF